MILYHATTQKMAAQYQRTGYIRTPVRGFTTLEGAMAWAIKTGRVVIYRIQANNPHKLPDHHNKYGEAWWNDGDVHTYHCEYSAT